MTNPRNVSQLERIALRIREMREIFGYTTEKMAELTDLTEEVYLSYESGKVDLPFTLMHKCAQTFGIELTDILEGHSAKLTGYTVTRKGSGLTTASAEKGYVSAFSIQSTASAFLPSA